MATASNLGFPRIGPRRELKSALEAYWGGKLSEESLVAVGQEIRRKNWLLQRHAGIEQIPSNDFSFYDQVLDHACLFGAIPQRYGGSEGKVSLATYFAMARGQATVPAMEMTKWFDTNYHYIVPEWERGQRFRIASTKPIDDFLEAKAMGIHTRPVLIGPVSLLLLGKVRGAAFHPLALLENLLPLYGEILGRLADVGASWVQMDEPCLVTHSDQETRQAYSQTYQELARRAPRLKLLLATYFDGIEDLGFALNLPVSGIHLDLVRAPEQLARALEIIPPSITASFGVIDGRNIWKADLERILFSLERAAKTLGKDRLLIAPSCSLLHVPVDLEPETHFDEESRNWFSFAKQKLDEIVTLTRAVNEGRQAVAPLLKANQEVLLRRQQSPRIRDEGVRERFGAVVPEMLCRKSPYAIRRIKQQQHLKLPLLPTTTIGSFPQTPEIRAVRAEYRSGRRPKEEYQKFLQAETRRAVEIQEELQIDVLVHGEFERTDMVEYFGAQLKGFLFTQQGWVQSYGSRYVKPPIIFGDVSRPRPMTVEWARYAQSLTQKPMKGMLTGPVTILQWSFVRDDHSRDVTCRQIALAIRDEVSDLEAAGIRVIQIDEPAIREGLPLNRSKWKEYLQWAVEAFRLASSGVGDETQIHTHMCYSEFNDIIKAVAAMDADVISIETSRSQMELLDAFQRYRYPNEIGPGVYDIHSPRIPSREEIEGLLRKALKVLAPEQVWVNPDCGLKTRRWEEVKPSLATMVAAAQRVRTELADQAARRSQVR